MAQTRTELREDKGKESAYFGFNITCHFNIIYIRHFA